MTMHPLTLKAKEILEEDAHTCVVVGEELYVSDKRGVAPLVELYEGGAGTRGAFAADKVVGAGAAYMYVLLGVAQIWAQVVSDAACEVFTRYGVDFHYEQKVPTIRNRTNTGTCPIEQTVADAKDASDAYDKIKVKLTELALQKR